MQSLVSRSCNTVEIRWKVYLSLASPIAHHHHQKVQLNAFVDHASLGIIAFHCFLPELVGYTRVTRPFPSVTVGERPGYARLLKHCVMTFYFK